MAHVIFKHFPNFITVLRMCAAPLFIYLLFFHQDHHFALFVLLTGAVATDFFDGFLARKLSATSSVGSFLDPLADKLFVHSAFISYAMLGFIEWWAVFLLLIRDVGITLLRVVRLQQKTALATSSLGKYKTVAQIVSLYGVLVVQFYFPQVNWTLDYVMFGVVAISWYSGIEYLRGVFRK